MTHRSSGTRPLASLLEGGTYFEAPRWRGDRWFVSDFFQHHVLSVTASGQTAEVLVVPAQPAGLGWLPDGTLLAVSMTDRRVLRRSPSGQVGLHADLSGVFPGPANDMVVDAEGRAYVGNFGYAELDPADPVIPPTCLAMVDVDGRVSIAAEGLHFPNGAVITPDGRTLIVGESAAARYTAFTIGRDGSLTDRRVWAQFDQDAGGGPDGCTLDAEGHLWVAEPERGSCRRCAPGGATVDEIAAPPGLTFYACALGGADGRTLLLCAAAPGAYSGAIPDTGVLLTTTVDVPHAGWP